MVRTLPFRRSLEGAPNEAPHKGYAERLARPVRKTAAGLVGMLVVGIVAVILFHDGDATEVAS